MINNYVSLHVLVQSIPIFTMCMFIGLVAQLDSIMVASSLPVGGLRTLHRIIVVARQKYPIQGFGNPQPTKCQLFVV